MLCLLLCANDLPKSTPLQLIWGNAKCSLCFLENKTMPDTLCTDFTHERVVEVPGRGRVLKIYTVHI